MQAALWLCEPYGQVSIVCDNFHNSFPGVYIDFRIIGLSLFAIMTIFYYGRGVMQGTDNEKAVRLMETVSFELDTDLRLHPQKLELGKAELLTDALTLPFTDIEKRLNQYIAGSSNDEKKQLQKSIKSYLAKLNANPMIPLHYRLKVLGRFEKELELFDSEMTAAVLNSHKIAVELVQKAAQNESTYHLVLVNMVSNALELAVKMLRIELEQYHSPAVLTTRQVFDLMRLGLSVVPVLSEQDISERKRLFQAVSNHEILRMLDFHSKTPHAQKITWQELQHHSGILEPQFVRKGKTSSELPNDTYITTHCGRPNDAAKIYSKLPSSFEVDMIIFPANAFIDRLVTAIDRVENVLKNPALQHNDLHTEEALQATIVGGNAILNTLRERQRTCERKNNTGTRTALEWDAGKAFVEASRAMALDEYEYAPAQYANREPWTVLDISKHGCALERLSDHMHEASVGSLIGLNWMPHNKEPMLGFIRWMKEIKPGEQRMGIEFFQNDFKLYKGAILGGGSADTSAARSWPVLVKAGKPYHTALFPDYRMFHDMVFLLTQDGKGAHFKVVEVKQSGANYCICAIAPVKELPTSKHFDVSS